MRHNRDPNYSNIPNNLAWALAMSPDRALGDYDEAAVLAGEAIALDPKAGASYNTLALAEYRRGRWDDSIAASERSMALTLGGNAYDWFLLAMAHAGKSEKDKASTWFDKAVIWTGKNAPKDPDLIRFRSESGRLLGRPWTARPDASQLHRLPANVFSR